MGIKEKTTYVRAASHVALLFKTSMESVIRFCQLLLQLILLCQQKSSIQGGNAIMVKESPLTALTSKFIIPEFTLCLRKSDFIKAEKKREKGKLVHTFAVTCSSRECLFSASTQKLLSAHFQNTRIHSLQFELTDNLSLLLTKHTKQEMTIKSSKPKELKEKLDSFSTFSTFVTQHG